MRARDRKVPIQQLMAAIEEVLKAGPRGIGEIARELGYSPVALRWRLEQLELENRAHRQREQIKSWSGLYYRWHHGPAAGNDALFAASPVQQEAGKAQQGMVPFQSTVRTYPAVNRRDPLVAALFGPSHQAGA